MRNLDVTTLRSFVAVADMGGVTRAAGHLNLTQSAVSMQLKRLEELLGIGLLDRANRTISLTTPGEQFLGFARRIVALNDEAVAKLTHQGHEGEITLGVPHDVVYPIVPRVLQRFNAEFPRMKVHLATTFTRDLKERFAQGDCDVILTTEEGLDPGGRTLREQPLKWVGAPEGSVWRQRPLRLAFGRHCIFRAAVIAALDKAGIDWDMVVDTESDRTIEATVSADLAVHAMIEGTEPQHLEQIDHEGSLPELAVQKINIYGKGQEGNASLDRLIELLRLSFQQM
ncbi:MAG: LysR family transcriptional regulator [Paracoccaceae bacterium]